MIDGNEKRNRQLTFELQNSHVCEKRGKLKLGEGETTNVQTKQVVKQKHTRVMG